MTRQFQHQQGYVSNPIRTRNGTVFKIRYRVPAAGGKFKHKKETLYGLDGKKAARAILNERLQQAGRVSPDAADLTLRGFVDAYWKPSLDRKQTKPSTLRGYQSVLDNHILPFLGEMLLADIAPINVEDLLQGKAREEYSPKTMRNIVVQLNGIFNLAVDNDLIARSPVRARHRPACRKTEKPSWSAEQVRKILESVPVEYRCLFTCVALTGIRLGELLALRWLDIDLQSKRLRVVHSLWKGQLVSPKTEASARKIALGGVLAAQLAAHRGGSVFTRPDDFVFCKRDGKPLNPDVLRKDILYPALDRLNIPRPKGVAGFHAFRHSAASLINAETGNLKLIQKFLGHANVSTTADIYTHTTEAMEREAAIALERSIFGNLFPVVPDLGTGNSFSVN
jgi:integrase